MENGLAIAPAPCFAEQRFYEYFLVVHPVEEACQQIAFEKQNFRKAYLQCLPLGDGGTKPHITVADFLAKEEMEDTIIRYMHRIVSTQKSFTITLNNYSGFPPHTVYARVQDHQPFKQLAASLKAIDQYVSSNGCPPAHFTAHPHLSIARSLQQNVYEKAMFDYSQKTFHASFQANELILLKRQTQYHACEQVNVFKLLTDRSL